MVTISQFDNCVVISGLVADGERHRLIEGVEISALSLSGESLGSCRSEEAGRWELHVDSAENEIEELRFSHESYVSLGLPLEEVRTADIIRLISADVLGYPVEIRHIPGAQVEMCVHALESFDVSIRRHGIELETVLELVDQDICTQQLPQGRFVESGLGWKPAVNFVLPRDCRPGLYSAELRQGSSESTCVFPLVVETPLRDIGISRQRVLVLASETTWLAYNVWGGRSRYRTYENGNGPVSSGGNVRASATWPRIRRKIRNCLPDKARDIYRWLYPYQPPSWITKRLNSHRPLTCCGLARHSVYEPFCNHLGDAEWCVLAWLEKEEIAYDYLASTSLNDEDIELDYDVIVLAGHSEYWTKEMYQRLVGENRNSGTWIVCLGGNTMFREIELDDEGITCTGFDFWQSGIDETELIGARFSDEDFATAAPYQVKRPDHWVFESMDVERKQEFGAKCLNRSVDIGPIDEYDAGKPTPDGLLLGEGASGWETDKRSRRHRRVFTMVAKGTNRGGGADMLVREPLGSQGGVFNASSICYSGSLLVDPVVSGITRNVFRRAMNGN